MCQKYDSVAESLFNAASNSSTYQLLLCNNNPPPEIQDCTRLDRPQYLYFSCYIDEVLFLTSISFYTQSFPSSVAQFIFYRTFKVGKTAPLSYKNLLFLLNEKLGLYATSPRFKIIWESQNKMSIINKK